MKNYIKYVLFFTASILLPAYLQAVPMHITFEEMLQRMGKEHLAGKNKLNAWQDDGHGYLEFICTNCNHGAGVHEFYSLYPADMEEENEQEEESTSLKSVLDINNNAILQIVGGMVFVGAKVAGLADSSLCDQKGEIKWHDKDESFRTRSRKISENVLSDAQAQAVWTKLQELLEKSKKGEMVYNGIAHNCMDFPQIIYEAAGLSGHYLNDFKQELDLYWYNGQICPGSVYAYAKYGGLRKLIEQIYAQMILGHTAKKTEEKKAMCERVVPNECWQQHQAIEAYEKAVANAYEVYIKSTYIGIEDDTLKITLNNPLAKSIKQQTTRGFQNMGFATEGSNLCFESKVDEDGTYFTYPLGTATYPGILDLETIEIRVNTDHEAQIYWVEVLIVGVE